MREYEIAEAVGLGKRVTQYELAYAVGLSPQRVSQLIARGETFETIMDGSYKRPVSVAACCAHCGTPRYHRHRPGKPPHKRSCPLRGPRCSVCREHGHNRRTCDGRYSTTLLAASASEDEVEPSEAPARAAGASEVGMNQNERYRLEAKRDAERACVEAAIAYVDAERQCWRPEPITEPDRGPRVTTAELRTRLEALRGAVEAVRR